ncbi:PQQ-binding-like beta-propeller repeat protein [Natronosalvus halobius]|uniref:outer membrane protein assembly factor BamB family protein n=1 Tax=Natronosalvus halobius TaxID=2953746 RepID=UPI00209CA720|nr:PQQ-binding-like beta-propeller repeat protein [Natronosalvus halobius]USZ72922.1 PQQ-binding-like beta-propeller repeat protein [Natronosalvus halobius]
MSDHSRRTFLRRTGLTITAGSALAAASGTTAVASTTAADPGDWPSLGGRPGNNARVASGIDDPGSLEVAWSCDCGGHVAVVDETVYLRADDGSVHAYEAEDGSQLWQTDDLGADRTPAFADGTVYVGGDGLTAVDAEDGDVRWQRDLEYSDGIRSPNVADETVFVVGDGVLYAIDATSGEAHWQFEPDDGELHEMSVPIDDGVVFVADETRLYAREASDGSERWTFDLEANDDDGQFSTVTPVVDYGILAVGYQDESDAGLSYHDVEFGGRIARVAGRAHNHPPVIGSELVYTVDGTNNDTATGHDIETGEKAWDPEPSGEGTSPLIIDEEHVYAGLESGPGSTDGDEESWMRFFAFDAWDGSVEWERDTRTVLSPLALVDETLYVGSVDGEALAALRPDGEGNDGKNGDDESDGGSEIDDDTDEEDGSNERGDSDDGGSENDSSDISEGNESDSTDDSSGSDETDDSNDTIGSNDSSDESATEDGGSSADETDDSTPGFTGVGALAGGGLAFEWLRRRVDEDEHEE